MARRREGGPPPWPPGPDDDPQWVAEVRARLASWYEEHRRDLPWRATRDPYRVLVSEIMLVQTTVAAVVPFYRRFLERFPTVSALAEADEGDVLKAWEGLGYYRRARQLHAAAKAIVERHGGVFPRGAEDVLALPGVGRYVAGAVLSFAFDEPAPVLEANTQRALARWLAWDEDVKTSRSQERLWAGATKLVPNESPGAFNQAFMELGALVCRPVAPACLVCPVSGPCRARALGAQGRIPVVSPPRPAKASRELALWLTRDDGSVLIVKRPDEGLWAGLWELPTWHLDGANPAGRPALEGGIAESAQRDLGGAVSEGEDLGAFSYGVTTHKVSCEAHRATWGGGELLADVGAEWRPPEKLGERAMTGPARALARRALGTAGPTE